MTSTVATHARERLVVRVGTTFAEMSVDTYVPARHRATVFCLHDFFGNSQDFRQLGTFLMGHHYRVVCPDMLGRGDSAYLSNPFHYRPAAYLFTLMAVMQKFADRRIVIIAKGWGALLALLLNAKTSFDLDRLVVSDLRATWSVPNEALPSADQLEFATLEQARSNVLASHDLARVPEPAASALADGRVRQTENGTFVLRFDPALIGQLGRYKEQSLDSTKLLARVKSPVLYTSADALSEQEIRTYRTAMINPRSAIADGLAPGARVHFNSAHQQLLVLGFLKSRLTVGE